jgi:hypothetical protein
MGEKPVWYQLETLAEGPYRYKITRPVPSAYEVKDCTYGRGMFSKKQYKKGEVMYLEGWHIIPNEPGSILLVLQHEGEEQEVQMDVMVHSVLNRLKTNGSCRIFL